MDQLIGPFRQIITMDHLSGYGPLMDEQLEVVKEGGVITDGEKIVKAGPFEDLADHKNVRQVTIDKDMVLLPGMIDAHTHVCYGGTRSDEYALKISGMSYPSILQQGGGILNTVKKTRELSADELLKITAGRVMRHVNEGITTMEIKSGYGLNMEDELKILQVINELNTITAADIIPTCLAAHVTPPEYQSAAAYLEFITAEILPVVVSKKLSERVDIFIEKNAFEPEESLHFLLKAKKMGYKITVHADQFTPGGSEIACRVKAVSADHLEAITPDYIRMLVENEVVATVLPGASLGLGMPFAPARDILDAGGCLAIASDWNPGSAPMGDLLLQAALISANQKLTFAETYAGISFRAAKALSCYDRGRICSGQIADIIAFPTNDFREILYHQGKMKPEIIWKKGKKLTKEYSGYEKTTG